MIEDKQPILLKKILDDMHSNNKNLPLPVKWTLTTDRKLRQTDRQTEV